MNTFFIAAMGPGEIGQGMAFARYALNRGDKIIFSVPEDHYLSLLPPATEKFSVLITSDAAKLKKAIHQKKPDALILCNSKIFTRSNEFQSAPPTPLPPTLSIDSNWLFHPNSPYQSNPWVHRYCINIPEPVFLLGLKRHGGQYNIPENTLKKIRVVGLLPSYRPIPKKERREIRTMYKIADNEKLIFLYTSIGYLVKPVVFLKALAAIKLLRKKGDKIKMIFFGDPPEVQVSPEDQSWLTVLPRTSTEHFSKVLASSDLVFQHQGLSTLEQAIGSRIPVIANVRNKKDEKFPGRHAHAWEVGPFARYGACAMFTFKSSIKTVTSRIKMLLYDEGIRNTMLKKQDELYDQGEANVYTEALKLIKELRS